MVVSLLWVAVAPGYARGLALVVRALLPVLETAHDTRYVVEGGRLLAQRTLWHPQQRTVSYKVPLWHPAANYGVPLLAALILATPAWRWRPRARALALGLGLLTLTQLAAVLVTSVATQQPTIINASGMIQFWGTAPTHPVFYVLFHFFEQMGRGFFALLIYLGFIALSWHPPARAPLACGRLLGRNAPCPCGSGRKAKRCCLA